MFWPPTREKVEAGYTLVYIKRSLYEHVTLTESEASEYMTWCIRD